MVGGKRKKTSRRSAGTKEPARRGAAQGASSGVAAAVLVEDDRSRTASGHLARRSTTSKRVPVQMPRKRVPAAGYAARAGSGAAARVGKVKTLRKAGATRERPVRADELN